MNIVVGAVPASGLGPVGILVDAASDIGIGARRLGGVDVSYRVRVGSLRIVQLAQALSPILDGIGRVRSLVRCATLIVNDDVEVQVWVVIDCSDEGVPVPLGSIVGIFVERDQEPSPGDGRGSPKGEREQSLRGRDVGSKGFVEQSSTFKRKPDICFQIWEPGISYMIP